MRARASVPKHGNAFDTDDAGFFDAAEAALDELDASAPPELAKLYAIMRGRIAVLRADPPAAGWDGTYTAREK